MKQSSFGRGAAVLAAIGIIAKLIGALYRVPLTNIVGAEGMGLYQMVFPLYTILLAFCGGGMTSAVSRVVAKYTAVGDGAAASRVPRVAMGPLFLVSAASVAAVVLLRNVISGVQGNTDAAIAYVALCPSLLFTSGISVLRGYFQGKSLMLPSGISQLTEQTVKLAAGLSLSKALMRYGVKYAVAGALIGVSLSEAAALLYLALRYALERKKRVVDLRGALAAEASAEFYAGTHVTDGALVKELYFFALSVTIGSLVLPVTQLIDSALVINLLMHGGASRADATKLFGLFVGPVGTLINMPTVVALSVSVAYLPAVTSAVARGEDASGLIKQAAQWIMLFTVPITAAFTVFPESVCAALYRKGLTDYQLTVAASLLRLEGISVFYIGMLQLVTAVLQAHNKAHVPVVNIVIGACIKVGLTPLLVRAFGIYGAAIATAACFAVAAALSARAAYKCAPIGLNVLDAFIKPVAASVLGAGAFYLCSLALNAFTDMNALWRTLVAAAAFAAVYAAAVVLSGAADIKSMISSVKKRKAEKSENTSA